MNISKFKLLDGGYSGITITAVESVRKGNMTILDQVQRTRGFTLSQHMIDKIQKLKYYFLNITGHWIEPYNKSWDVNNNCIINPKEGEEPTKSYMLLKNLLNHTLITGVTTKNAGFSIQGSIESVEGKKYGLSSPFITEEDDLSFFISASALIHEILDDIAGLMMSQAAIDFDPKAVLEAQKIDTKDMGSLSSDEMIDLVIQKFESRGAIVMMSGDEPAQLTQNAGKQPDKLNTNTKSIDSHNIEAAEEHHESEKEQINEDKIVKKTKKDSKSTIASSKGFPDLDNPEKTVDENKEVAGASLEDMEFSENMGIPAEGAGLEGNENVPWED